MTRARIQPLPPGASFQRLRRPHLAFTPGDVLQARTDPAAMERLIRDAEPVLRWLCAFVAERPAAEGQAVVTVAQEDACGILQAARAGLWRACQQYEPARGSPDLFLARGAYLAAFTARRAALRPEASALVSADDALVWRDADGSEVARGLDAVPAGSNRDLRLPWDAQLDEPEPSPAERQERAAALLQTLVDTLPDPDARAVGQLAFIEGRSQGFIAEALALPPARVAYLARRARAALVKLAREHPAREDWQDDATADRERPAPADLDDSTPADERDPWAGVPPFRIFAISRGVVCTEHGATECPDCFPLVLASSLDVATAGREEMARRLRGRFQVLPTMPPGETGGRNLTTVTRARKVARRLGLLTSELESIAVDEAA